MAKEKIQPGEASGHTFILDEQFLTHHHLRYGNTTRIPREAIQTVVVGVKGWETSSLTIIGQGTELASIEMPYGLAAETQTWLIERLRPNTKAGGGRT